MLNAIVLIAKAGALAEFGWTALCCSANIAAASIWQRYGNEMYQLYWSPGGANMAPHAALIEIGVPFELMKVDLDLGQQRDPAYLKLNPHARVPTLVYDGDQVMYEAAAICLFLAERHPEVALAPAVQTRRRGEFLQWMAYLTNTVQEALIQWWHTDLYVSDEAGRHAFRANTETRLDRMFDFLNSHLGANGPFLCGDRRFICDTYLAMLCRWSRKLARPAASRPNLQRFLSTVITTEAYTRMLVEEGIA